MLVTAKLGSYQAARGWVLRLVEHRCSRYLNNSGGKLPPTDLTARTCHETVHLSPARPAVPLCIQWHLPALPAPPPPTERQRLSPRDGYLIHHLERDRGHNHGCLTPASEIDPIDPTMAVPPDSPSKLTTPATAAESAAEEALTELEVAQAGIEQFREQLATLRQETADLMAARTELAERLVAESERTEQQRHRAETAEQHASRASGQVDYLSAELTTLREQLEHWQSQAADQRAELAGLRSELTAARAAIETEKAHGAQRLTDQQTRHEETIGELRAQLREAAPSPQQRRTSRRSSTQDR